MTTRFHCCATCCHFAAEKKSGGGMRYYCERLGFETKTTYQFSCWDPKNHVKELMRKHHHSSS
ncbi:hypothetical protein ACFFHM_23550 [Halalkalibacter kiskunsagensis]|uniref:Uncharacterized protein n=1 Tax=Halalkalibacter kiskunsagensis TaxID=1548599 RepID=A0ABV6KN05_9BACI